MNVSEAIDQACAAVGIKPPRSYREGSWARTDTLSGRNGKGDGAIRVNPMSVSARNWQTGELATVRLKDKANPVERKQMAERRQKDDGERREKAARASRIATEMVGAAKQATHAYFARKGFPNEQALVLAAQEVRAFGGDYLVPEGGQSAVVMPARIGARITSVQLIWEDGTKKFLAGGETGGASHRIATGADTWLCEGYATGVSLRAVLRSLSRQDTILCCFSASNVFAVSRTIKGRCFIAADNDKPLPQFDGLGTGEHYAKQAERLYLMPPLVGTDINDFHMSDGIFAVQKLVSGFLRSVKGKAA